MGDNGGGSTFYLVVFILVSATYLHIVDKEDGDYNVRTHNQLRSF